MKAINRTPFDLFNREFNGPITFVRHFGEKSAKKVCTADSMWTIAIILELVELGGTK